MAGSEKHDVVIIGAGLGGLMCGAFLSKKGYGVCILEQHHQIGGNLQTFKRKGVQFNSAMHYVGAADPDQILGRIFHYLGIEEETGLVKLAPEAYEVVHLDDRQFVHACGFEAHRERLLSYFPKEARAIDAYLDKIRDVWNSTRVMNLQDFRSVYEADTQYTQINAHDYIDSLTGNEDLKALWGMTSALYAGVPDRSPLITHAIIQHHYIQSAYKFDGGSDMLASSLARVIRENGGQVITRREVTGFRYEGRDIRAALLADGQEVEGKAFISNIHPARLVDMVDTGYFRKAYGSRIRELENTSGSFCLYLALKPGKIRNISSNVFIARGRKVWTSATYREEDWPDACIMYTTPDPVRPGMAESMMVSAFMKYSEVEGWSGTEIENRGSDYMAFKDEKADALISLVEERYPGLRESIADRYTATPLTFRDYTGIPEGSAYGILKDHRQPRWSYISPHTRIPNLCLTGQNSGVGQHGVLGVSVSALFTCAAFLDIGILLEEIRNG